MRVTFLPASAAAVVFLFAASAAAQSTPAAEPAPPAPYVAPFAPRGTGAGTSVRAETAYGLDTGVSSTIVQYLAASWAPVEHLSLYGRTGWSYYFPNAGPATSAFTNLAVGALCAYKLGRDFRWSATIGTGLPVGQGGGDDPDPGEAAALAAGSLARSRFEGSTMFSPNDVAPYLGGDLAWVRGGFTLQAEVTVFALFRVRGDGTNPATGKPWDPDAVKGSVDLAFHAGYFVVPQLSVQVEVRDQTYLGTPAAVAAGNISQSWVTVGGGVRGHLKLGPKASFHPGIAFFQPLNDAILKPTVHTALSYHVFLLDLPVSF